MARGLAHRFNDGAPFVLGRGDNSSAAIYPPQGTIGRYTHYPQPIDRAQLARDLGRSSRHAAKVEVSTEKTLIGNSCKRLIAFGDCAVFLGLDQLVKTALP